MKNITHRRRFWLASSGIGDSTGTGPCSHVYPPPPLYGYNRPTAKDVSAALSTAPHCSNTWTIAPGTAPIGGAPCAVQPATVRAQLATPEGPPALNSSLHLSFSVRVWLGGRVRDEGGGAASVPSIADRPPRGNGEGRSYCAHGRLVFNASYHCQWEWQWQWQSEPVQPQIQ